MIIAWLRRRLIKCWTHHTHYAAHFSEHWTKYIIVSRILRVAGTERTRRNYGNWGKSWAVLDNFLLIKVSRRVCCHFHIFPIIVSLRSSSQLILNLTIFNFIFLVIIIRISLIWALGSLHIVMIIFNNVLFSDALHCIWFFDKYLVIYIITITLFKILHTRFVCDFETTNTSKQERYYKYQTDRVYFNEWCHIN